MYTVGAKLDVEINTKPELAFSSLSCDVLAPSPNYEKLRK